MSNDVREKEALAWKNFGAVCGPEAIDTLMYEATKPLVEPNDSLSTGRNIGRRDLALELLNRMGVT